jgi:hypothetical protein
VREREEKKMSDKSKKTYTITFSSAENADNFKKYLDSWHVSPKSYTRNDLVFTTQDTNVVDVCTEHFLHPNITVQKPDRNKVTP